jgi:hypothetical protein
VALAGSYFQGEEFSDMPGWVIGDDARAEAWGTPPPVSPMGGTANLCLRPFARSSLELARLIHDGGGFEAADIA